MDFKEQLKNSIKTPEEIENDERNSAYSSAKSLYRNIKEAFLNEAKAGNLKADDQKRIVTYVKIPFDDFLETIDVNTTVPCGFMNLRSKIVVQKMIAIKEKNRKRYEYYMSSIKEIAGEDGIKVTPVAYDYPRKEEYPIPTPIPTPSVNIFPHRFELYLKCEIVLD